jgi:hypothetical protein
MDEGYHGYRCALASNAEDGCFDSGHFLQIAEFEDSEEDDLNSECAQYEGQCLENISFTQLARVNHDGLVNLSNGDNAEMEFWAVGSDLMCAVEDGTGGTMVRADAGGAESFSEGGVGFSTLNMYGDFDSIMVCEAFEIPELPEEAEPTHTLNWGGTGYTSYNGKTVNVHVVDVSDGSVVESDAQTIASGAFNFSFPALLEQGHTYVVDSYVDVDGNLSCTAAGDVVRRDSESILDVAGNVTATHAFSMANLDENAGCDTFDGTGFTGGNDLTFGGSSYGVHNNQTLSAVVYEAATGKIVDRSSEVVQGGLFSFTFGGILATGVDYDVAWWADVDKDGVCDGPSSSLDHAYQDTTALADVAGDVTVNHVHDTNFASVCLLF